MKPIGIYRAFCVAIHYNPRQSPSGHTGYKSLVFVYVAMVADSTNGKNTQIAQQLPVYRKDHNLQIILRTVARIHKSSGHTTQRDQQWALLDWVSLLKCHAIYNRYQGTTLYTPLLNQPQSAEQVYH